MKTITSKCEHRLSSSREFAADATNSPKLDENMKTINIKNLQHEEVNELLRELEGEVALEGCLGHRFIAAGMSDKRITLSGIPGNALGAYLNGANLIVKGNAQDAVGDTMNEGEIIIHGNVGDAAGYAMRGGRIFVRGNAGYRAGIHMKAYKEKMPVMVIGGCTGSFLGEYQAGGRILVLGLDTDRRIVGNFPCTGMHGGKMYLRSDCKGIKFPGQVTATTPTAEEMAEIEGYVTEFCAHFGYDAAEILSSPFTVITPDSKNPYKQMYVAN